MPISVVDALLTEPLLLLKAEEVKSLQFYENMITVVGMKRYIQF